MDHWHRSKWAAAAVVAAAAAGPFAGQLRDLGQACSSSLSEKEWITLSILDRLEA